MPGCPEDRKRDGGRGGRGVVASRGDGRADKGPGEEAEKTGKDTGRERIYHSAQHQRNCSISPLTWPARLILERFVRMETP